MTPENADDVQLLNRASAGDEAAFVMLYRRWQGPIYRFALRLSNSVSAAEDVTQEVFLTLMGGCARFDPALGSFSAYIYGIARNQVLRRITREQPMAPIAEDPEDDQSALQEACRYPSDPLGNLARQEMVDTLHNAIAALPLRYREVVVLCELQEMKYAEAGQALGCAEGTIRSRLHRARTLLLKKLHEKAKTDSRAPGVEPARCVL
jgi:RNA polymerase sigma-70 factor (ECF subfamily)